MEEVQDWEESNQQLPTKKCSHSSSELPRRSENGTQWINYTDSIWKPMPISLKYFNTYSWKARSQYHYVKFPLGLMDTKGLKDLLALYDHCNALKRTLEEKKWLNIKASVPHHNMCIKESNLLSSLSTDQITCSKPRRHSMAYRCQCGVHGQPYQLNN